MPRSGSSLCPPPGFHIEPSFITQTAVELTPASLPPLVLNTGIEPATPRRVHQHGPCSYLYPMNSTDSLGRLFKSYQSWQLHFFLLRHQGQEGPFLAPLCAVSSVDDWLWYWKPVKRTSTPFIPPTLYLITCLRATPPFIRVHLINAEMRNGSYPFSIVPSSGSGLYFKLVAMREIFRVFITLKSVVVTWDSFVKKRPAAATFFHITVFI